MRKIFAKILEEKLVQDKNNFLITGDLGFKVLDNASLETLKKWKFTPAKIGNKFVDDTVKIPVKFLIKN